MLERFFDVSFFVLVFFSLVSAQRKTKILHQFMTLFGFAPVSWYSISFGGLKPINEFSLANGLNDSFYGRKVERKNHVKAENGW